MSVKIRKAVENDLNRVVELSNQVLEYHCQLVPNLFAPMDKEKAFNHYADLLEDEKYYLLIAEQDAQVIGYLYAEFVDTPWQQKRYGCRLEEIAVDVSCQSKGIGTILFDALREECVKRGIEDIRLNVYLANERGIEFYHRLGFREVSYKMTLDL